MLIDNLRQLESKNLDISKYNVYDSLIILRSKKSSYLTSIRKKDFFLPFKVSNNITKSAQLIALFNNNNVRMSKRVIFDRFDTSYLVKKLLLKKLFVNFLNLKLIALQQLNLKKIYAFNGLKVVRKLRSRNIKYNKGKLVFVLGKSLFISRTLLNYISKKLPFKVFKSYLNIKITVRYIFNLISSLRELKGFFLSNFNSMLKSRVLFASLVASIFSRKLYKFLNILGKVAFIKHKFEVMKLFSFFKYTLKKEISVMFTSVYDLLPAFSFFYVFSTRFLNNSLVSIFKEFLLCKIYALKKINYVCLNASVLSKVFYKDFNFSIFRFTNLFKLIYVNFVLNRNIFLYSKYFFYALRRMWLKILRKNSLVFSFSEFFKKSTILVGKYVALNSIIKLNKVVYGARYVFQFGQSLLSNKRIKQMGIIMHTLWKLYKFKGRSFLKILKRLTVLGYRSILTFYRINKYVNPYINFKFPFRKGLRKFSKLRRTNVVNYKKIQNKNLFKKNFKYATIR